MDIVKRTILLLAFLALLLPLNGQNQADTTYCFRFVADKDMFFVPWNDNGRELDRLLAAIKERRPAIESGGMYILVASYGTNGTAGQAAEVMARIRRSRVKSELIMRGGIKEEHFVTDKSFTGPYRGRRNMVVVTLPAGVEKVAEIAGTEAAARVETYNREVSGEAERERLVAERKAEEERLAREQAEQDSIAAERARLAALRAEEDAAATEKDVSADLQSAESSSVLADLQSASLRANLLRWATLTPDLGIEWQFARRWSVVVDGSWTSWSWDNRNRRYALWEVSPEVRYYLAESNKFYLGAQYKIGEFNYKLGCTGKQGDLQGGGITFGYKMPIGKRLALDLNAAAGCLHASYESYRVADGVRVKECDRSKNVWGLTDLGVTLVWIIK